MPQIIQPSFAKGELSPELFGRVDTAAYSIGLATARNAVVHTYGGVGNRPGTTWIAPVADHSYAPRLIEFQFKTTDSYILEFGDLYMRVIRDDGHVVETAVVVSGATQASPVVVTATSHGYTNNDEVFLTGIVGMTQLNGNRYYIANVTTHTFELTDQVTGVDIDGTAYGAYVSAGTSAKVFEIVTPYAIADMPTLNYTQSADVMTLVHPSYEPRELTRTDHDAWTLTAVPIGPVIADPQSITVTVDTSGSETETYSVTAISTATGEESLVGLNNTSRTITAATAANPVVITSGSHGFLNLDQVEINGIVGMTELNGRRFIVANQTTNTFELTDEDGTSHTAYSSAGTATQTFVRITNAAATRDNTIAWGAVAGADRYAIYLLDNGLDILLGETKTLTFKDANITGESASSPPDFRDPFPTVNDNPGAVTYFEQRRVFGGSVNKPDTSVYSQTGNQSNFNVANPVQDDDAITATLNSKQVNEIKHYIPGNDLLVMTSGSEWRVHAGPDAFFGPNTIKQKPQSDWGIARHRPVSVGDSSIFVTAANDSVRAISYSFQADGYTSANLNILSAHLLQGKQVSDMCYVRSPESRLFMVLDDGTALALSYEPEQEVIAWSRFDTDGLYERCAALRGGGSFGEDSMYWVTKRLIGTTTVRYIEVMRDTFFDDVKDAFFLDSGLTLDVPLAMTNSTATDPVVITAGGANGVVAATGISPTMIVTGEIDADDKFATHAGTLGSQATLILGSTALNGIGAIDFNPSGAVNPSLSYVSYVDSNDFNFGSDAFTIEFEVSFKDLTESFQALASHYTNTGNQRGWHISRSGNNLLFFGSDDGTDIAPAATITGAFTWAIDTQYHVAVTRDDVGDVRMFVSTNNATSVQVGTTTAMTFAFHNSTSPLWLGKFRSAHDRPLDGLMKNFKITIGDAVYVAPFTPPTTQPLFTHGLNNGDTIDISDIIWTTDTSIEGIETQPDQLNDGRYTVANRTTATFEVQDEFGDVVGSSFNAYVSGGNVRLAVTTIDGLEHLAGETVTALADGNVVTGLTVGSTGIVTLVNKASRVHIGIPYSMDIETLNVEAPDGTIQGRPKHIPKVTARLFKSRGGFWGPTSTELVEFKQRDNERWNHPTALLTDDIEIYLKPSWNSNGRIFFHQKDPLPFTLLAVIPDVEVGDV